MHDDGPYRIYPLPVPRYDQADQPKTITAEEGPIPGGGNLVVRRQVFELAGQFSTELGPHGHDLGGGEDSEYVLRAMNRGVRCQYTPDMVQHHYVDTERLRLGYLLKKSYQRTRSTSRIHGNGRVPLFMWRKLAEYGFHSLFSLSWARRRFYWMRTAAALGEVQGRRESGFRGRGLALPPTAACWELKPWHCSPAPAASSPGSPQVTPLGRHPARDWASQAWGRRHCSPNRCSIFRRPGRACARKCSPITGATPCLHWHA